MPGEVNCATIQPLSSSPPEGVTKERRYSVRQWVWGAESRRGGGLSARVPNRPFLSVDAPGPVPLVSDSLYTSTIIHRILPMEV